MDPENPGMEPHVTRSAQGADLIIPVMAAGFTIYFLASTWRLTWEARANGVAIGALLLVLIAIQLVRIGVGVAAGRYSPAFGGFVAPSPAQAQRLALIAILIVWIATIPWFGTTLSLVLVMAASMWVLGVRSWKTLASVSLGTAACVYLLFILMLRSRLPRGLFEDMVARLITGGG